MSLAQALQERSEGKCELCSTTNDLNTYEVQPVRGAEVDTNVLICSTCESQIDAPETAEANHWRCLNDSMWTPVPAVQVLAWRMLNHLKTEGWPQDLLDMLYLDEETLDWAQALETAQASVLVHKDSNGAILEAGDTVTLIKDLNVKGASFTAKRGTAVRRISLVADNAAHIEGKIEGQRIVILTQYVKKQSK